MRKDIGAGIKEGSSSEFFQHSPKPPLGIVPKFIHDRQRASQILEAMNRYIKEGFAIPSEWVDELRMYIKTK